MYTIKNQFCLLHLDFRCSNGFKNIYTQEKFSNSKISKTFNPIEYNKGAEKYYVDN